MQFTKLRALRDKLASIPSHLVDADTRREIVAAINELDDAMVKWVRAEHFAKTQHEAAPSFDIADFANTQFALIASIQMAVTS
jgi:hypothetical protein